MTEAICPSCNAVLPPQEIAEGWCETCGKKIPAWVRGQVPAPPMTERDWIPSSGRGISLTYRPLASRPARLGAAILDTILWFGLVTLSQAAVNVLWPDQERIREEVGSWFVLGISGVVALVQVVLLSLSGQTIGKKIMRIRIVRVDDETNPGFLGAVLLRAAVPALIGWVPCVGAIFGIVDILYIFGDDRRCLHDYIAGTKVVVA